MLSQKLRNYFHHIISLKTEAKHVPNKSQTIPFKNFDSHKKLVEHIKKDSLYTQLYRSELAFFKGMMIDFKWNVELAVTHSKASVLDEWRYLERNETKTIHKLIEDEIDRLPTPSLTDEEKVLHWIGYCKEMDCLSLTEGSYKTYSENLQRAYINWKKANYDSPILS